MPALAAALLSLSAPAAALSYDPARPPRDLALRPDARVGGLIFAMTPVTVPIQLLLTRDSDTTRRPAEWIGIPAAKVGTGMRLLAVRLPPGRYRLDAVIQQSRWLACLHDRTLTIDVAAGTLNWLGALDVGPTLATLQRAAQASGAARAAQFQWPTFRDGMTPPTLISGTAADLESVAATVARTMPRTTVRPTRAPVEWTGFAPGPSAPGRC